MKRNYSDSIVNITKYDIKGKLKSDDRLDAKALLFEVIEYHLTNLVSRNINYGVDQMTILSGWSGLNSSFVGYLDDKKIHYLVGNMENDFVQICDVNKNQYKTAFIRLLDMGKKGNN